MMPKNWYIDGFTNEEPPEDPERQDVILTKLEDGNAYIQIDGVQGNPYIELHPKEVEFIKKYHNVIWSENGK